MKRVTCELVTVVEVVTPAADDEGAIALAEALVRSRYKGQGYACRNFRVEDAPDGEPSVRWWKPE